MNENQNPNVSNVEEESVSTTENISDIAKLTEGMTEVTDNKSVEEPKTEEVKQEPAKTPGPALPNGAKKTPRVIEPILENTKKKGMVYDNEEIKTELDDYVPKDYTMTPETKDNVAETLKMMDEENAVMLKEMQDFKAKVDSGEVVQEQTPEYVDEDGNPVQEELVILIDKRGIGDVSFSEEEKEKIERVKSITIKEVECIELA